MQHETNMTMPRRDLRIPIHQRITTQVCSTLRVSVNLHHFRQVMRYTFQEVVVELEFDARAVN